MTSYNEWDKKAEALCKEADEDDEREKKNNDEALGLQDGPRGPPTEKCRQQRAKMGEHSDGRAAFIAKQEAKEIVLEHSSSAEPIVVSADECGDKAVRLKGSKDVTYQFPRDLSLIKLYVESCRNVKIRLGCCIKTSFVEVSHSSDVELRIESVVSTLQCDECSEGPLRIEFLEPEGVGTFFHHNCPFLEVVLPGQTEPLRFGRSDKVQLCSRPDSSGNFTTEAVIRGEKDFPVNLGSGRPTGAAAEPEAEKPPTSEERRLHAEAKRAEGNEAFRASDFLQAAVYYTEAINQCDDLHLAWANRAQCFLKTGQPVKALEDATRCTELAPDYAKGWFRKGMSLHALEQYGKAIPAFVEAEKLDPRNPQIPEAIKMAQLMCRQKGPGDMS
jgi:hypothetical protein